MERQFELLEPQLSYWTTKSYVDTLNTCVTNLSTNTWNVSSNFWNLSNSYWTTKSYVDTLNTCVTNLSTNTWNVSSNFWNLSNSYWTTKSYVDTLNTCVTNLSTNTWNVSSNFWNISNSYWTTKGYVDKLNTCVTSLSTTAWNVSSNFWTVFSMNATNASLNKNLSCINVSGVNLSLSGNLSANNGYFINNVYAGYSDDRLKVRLNNISNCLSRIMKLSTFEYFPNISKCETIGITVPFKKDIGMSAQEVQSVFPEIVCTAPCDIDIDFVTGEQHSKTGLNLLTVRYERLVPILIQSLKELTQRVEIIENVLFDNGSIPKGVVL